jgi:hypothetical protein
MLRIVVLIALVIGAVMAMTAVTVTVSNASNASNASTTPTAAAVLPGQPHPDLFDCGNGLTCDAFNALTRQGRVYRSATYRLEVLPGCVASSAVGSAAADMAALEDELQRVGFTLTRNDAAPNFTVRINCGTSQANICGSIYIFCLGRGYPYSQDVDISDVMYTMGYPYISRLSIYCHEICGHAIASWNEQYCIGNEPPGNVCYGLTRFTSAPNWRDFMNTGEQSRHLFETVEFGRWERTMYPLTCDPCWDGQRWVFGDGWSFYPSDGSWWGPTGLLEFSACNQDNIRWAYRIERWVTPTSMFYDPVVGYWARVPEC